MRSDKAYEKFKNVHYALHTNVIKNSLKTKQRDAKQRPKSLL